MWGNYLDGDGDVEGTVDSLLDDTGRSSAQFLPDEKVVLGGLEECGDEFSSDFHHAFGTDVQVLAYEAKSIAADF